MKVKSTPAAPVKLSLGGMLSYSAASLGMGFFYALKNFSLPLFLRGYTSNDALIGILTNSRSFEGSLVQPVIGALSDRTWTRMGRRKPFFALGMPLIVTLVVYCAFRPPFALLIVADLLSTLLFNLGVDPYTALQSDIAPPRQRSTVNSIVTLLGAAGQLAFALVSGFLLWGINPSYSFFLVAATMAVTYCITIFGVRERRDNVQIREPLKLREHAAALSRYPDILRFYVVQFFLWFGINAATPFLTLFASRDVPGVSAGMAQILAALLLGLTALCALPVGILGDRFSRKRLMQLGLLLFGGGALLTGFCARSLPVLALLIVVIGIGNTFHTVLSYPLLTEIAPADRMGEFWGLNTFFSSFAALFSAALAGWLADIFGTYRAVFVFTAACMFAALVALEFVQRGTRERPARRPPTKTDTVSAADGPS